MSILRCRRESSLRESLRIIRSVLNKRSLPAGRRRDTAVYVGSCSLTWGSPDLRIGESHSLRLIVYRTS